MVQTIADEQDEFDGRVIATLQDDADVTSHVIQ